MSEGKRLTKSYILMLIGALLGTLFSDQLLLRSFQLPDPSYASNMSLTLPSSSVVTTT